jgi:hypothetical protein
MPDYKKGKIYKLVSDQTNDVYIGSTCQTLCQRLTDHKSRMKRHEAGKERFTTSQNIVKFDDVKIILIEDFPCERKEQLEAREYYHMKNEPNCCNKVMPTRTKKQYQEDKKDIIKQYTSNLPENKKVYNQSYYEKHKEQMIAKYKEPYVCECGRTIRHAGKAEHERTKFHQAFLII